MQCVVQRPFEGPGARVFQAGELVEAEEWKNRDKLVAQRYLRPATGDEIASAEPADPVFVTTRKSKRGKA